MIWLNSTLQTVAFGTAALGALAGALGTFAVLRRQSLLADAVSHAALPGVVLLFLLTRVQKWSWLKAWAMNVAKRRGLQKAIVALARRLSVIMHRMWRDGTEFRWTRQEMPIAA